MLAAPKNVLYSYTCGRSEYIPLEWVGWFDKHKKGKSEYELQKKKHKKEKYIEIKKCFAFKDFKKV